MFGIPREFQPMILMGSDLDGVDFSGKASGSDGAGGYIYKQCFDYVLHDSMRLTAAAGVYNPGSFELFNRAKNTVGSIGNGTSPLATFTKTAYDTNMITNNQLPEGWFFCFHSIAIMLEIPAAVDATPIGTGNTIIPTRGADGSSDNLLAALNQSLNFRFLVNTTKLEDGPIWQYPSPYGINGSMASTGTNATPLWGGVFNNGFGTGRPMTFPRHLKQRQQFSAFFDNPNTITVTRDCSVRVALTGWMFIPVT